MITSSLYANDGLTRYPEPIRKALRFLQTHDLTAMEPGVYEIEGQDIFAQVFDTTTGPRQEKKPEVHRTYIDVQFLASCLAGCSSTTPSASDGGSGGGAAVELNVSLAHNQTSADNPYVISSEKFKTALEEVSGGRATATLYHGTLGENESELIEKLEMGAVNMTIASPGFMTSLSE